MPPRNRHPFKQQPRDTRAHQLLEYVLDHGYLDSGADYVLPGTLTHESANEARLSVRRGARHFGVSCAARVIGPDGEQCTYDCPDPSAAHTSAFALYSKEAGRRHVVRQYGGNPAAMKYNPYRRRQR
jgi:hypothetical protein